MRPDSFLPFLPFFGLFGRKVVDSNGPYANKLSVFLTVSDPKPKVFMTRRP